MKSFFSTSRVERAKPINRAKTIICKILPSTIAAKGFTGTKPVIVSQKPGMEPLWDISTSTLASAIASKAILSPGWKASLNRIPKTTATAVVTP